MKGSTITTLISLLIVSACNSEIKNDLITLNLDTSLKASVPKPELLDSKYEVISATILDEDVLLRNPKLFYAGQGLYGLRDSEIMFFDAKTGELISKWSHKGRGPKEYISASTVSVRDTVVCVSDSYSASKALFYNIKGDFLKAISLPINSNGQFVGKDEFILTYSNLSEDKDFSLYKGDKLLRESLLEPKYNSPEGLYYATSVMEYNDDCFACLAYSDTLYKLTAEANLPYLIMDPGTKRKKMPENRQLVFDDMFGDRSGYILDRSARISGNLAFVTFGYNGKSYKEVWDLDSEEMLFKTFLSQEVGIMSTGFPVKLGDEAIPFWPDYVKGNDIYCVWSGDFTTGEEYPTTIVHLRVK